MKATAESWLNSLAVARLASSVLGGELSDKMSTIVELLLALAWTVYFIIEAGVKLILPSHLFHKDIAGQIVLITGGGSGIGRLMCLKFAKLGAHVVTWDINCKGNEETVEMVAKQGCKATGYTVDMSSKQEIYEAAKKTKAEVGTVSILVNNAGIVSGSALLDTPDGRIVKTFEVNVLAHFWTIKHLLPSQAMMKLSSAFGANCSMDQFTGREKQA